MRRPRLDHILKVWQPRCRIRDYDITIRYSKKSEDSDFLATNEKESDSVALNYINTHERNSLILIHRLIDPKIIVPTVVHELWHIPLEWWKVKAGTAEYDLKEAAINQMTDAIIEAYGYGH